MNNEQYNKYLEDCYGVEDFQSLREFQLSNFFQNLKNGKAPQNFDDLMTHQAKEQANKADISETLKQISFLIYQNKDKDILSPENADVPSPENADVPGSENAAMKQAKEWKKNLEDTGYNINTINQLVQNIYRKGLSQPNNDEKTNETIQANLEAIDLLSNSSQGSETSLKSIVQKTLDSNKALNNLYSTGNTSTQNNTNTINNKGEDGFAQAQANLKNGLETAAKGLYNLPDNIKSVLGDNYGIDANAAPAVILKDISTILKQQPAALKGLSNYLNRAAKKDSSIESIAKSLGAVINQANTSASAAARRQAMLHPEIAAQAAASQEAINKNNTELVNTFLQSLSDPNGNFVIGVAKDLKANHGWNGTDEANAQSASTIVQAGLDNAQTNVNQFINSLTTTGMNLIKTGQTLGSRNSSGAKNSSTSSSEDSDEGAGGIAANASAGDQAMRDVLPG